MKGGSDKRHRIQISVTTKTLGMLDEMCEANGSLSRSDMVEMAVRRHFFADEITQQMRSLRKTPKR